MNWVWTRKLGVFELLLGLTIFELVFVSRLSALGYGFAAFVAWYAKKKFQGEFSLRDAWSVVAEAGEQAAKKMDDN